MSRIESIPGKRRTFGLSPLAIGLCACGLAAAGCTEREYVERCDDWAEVFTLTVGTGVGAKARVGPLALGLYRGTDKAGLRAGAWGSSWDLHDNYDYLWGCYGQEYFDGWAGTRPPLSPRKRVAATVFVPFAVSRAAPNPYGFHTSYGETKYTDGAANDAYWTQLDVVIALGGGVRLGFNPGELLDAIGGHVGLDIYGDDFRKEAPQAKSDAELRERNPVLNKPGTLPVHPAAARATK